jgi:hypothetical protein
VPHRAHTDNASVSPIFFFLSSVSGLVTRCPSVCITRSMPTVVSLLGNSLFHKAVTARLSDSNKQFYSDPFRIYKQFLAELIKPTCLPHRFHPTDPILYYYYYYSYYYYYYYYYYYKKLNSVTVVRKRTIPTERPPLVGEVNANLCE